MDEPTREEMHEDEALALLADGTAQPIAGATDLMVDWPQHLEAHDRTFLDLSGIAELRPLEWTDDALLLGALTTYWDVLQEPLARRELPLLGEAARQVGAVQIQTRGTWAGNSISENLNYRHFINVTHLVTTVAEDKPSEDDLFGAYHARYGTD